MRLGVNPDMVIKHASSRKSQLRLRPHHDGRPVLKRESHRLALVEAATSGDASFFLGTDNAPHPSRDKKNTCGCAGIYTAHAAIEIYAEVFDHADALDRLEPFASFHGADFYRLPRNTEQITLLKKPWQVAERSTWTMRP